MRKVRREGPHSCIPHFLCHLENNTPVLSVALHSIIVCAHHMQHRYGALCPHKSPPSRSPQTDLASEEIKTKKEKKENPQTNKKALLLFLSLHLLSLCLSFVLCVPPTPFPSPPPCPHLRVLRPQAFHGKVSQWLLHNVISLFSRLPLPRLHRAQWRDMMMMEGGEGG